MEESLGISSDFEDLFKTLNDYKIRYLVVGGHAYMFYAEPRYTKAIIDVWIIPEMNDVQNVFDALKSFGAPLTGVTPEDFRDKNMVFQIVVAPVRVDIMVDVQGISFDVAWKNRKRTHYGRERINVLGIEELIKTKKKANRGQDKLDIEKLLDRRRRQHAKKRKK